MKVFGAIAALFLLSTTASFAQINIQGEDGSTVTIGPSGININGRTTGKRANVMLGPGGIQIDSNNGYKRARVNLGQGATVRTTQKSKVVTTKGHEYATTTTAVPVGPALADMVVNENNQLIKGHCDGNSIVLNGNNCQLQLSGKVGLVTINGNNNRIKSDKFEIVVANGNSNSVVWTHSQGAPMVTNNGRDNAIHQQ